MNDRRPALARTVADLSIAGADRTLVTEMQRQSEIFIANLKGLDGLVRDRIDANVAVDAVMARLPGLAAAVTNVAERRSSASGGRGCNRPRPSPPPIEHTWSNGRLQVWKPSRSC